MVITMMNPSKARHDESDPTLDKVIHFAKQEACRGRARAQPRGLQLEESTRPWTRVDDPVGPMNAEVLALDALFAKRVVAWGNFPSKRVPGDRLVRSIIELKRRYWPTLLVFGVNGSSRGAEAPALPAERDEARALGGSQLTNVTRTQKEKVMATKNNPGKFDCYTNAEPDEPMFILLGRDPVARF